MSTYLVVNIQVTYLGNGVHLNAIPPNYSSLDLSVLNVTLICENDLKKFNCFRPVLQGIKEE